MAIIIDNVADSTRRLFDKTGQKLFEIHPPQRRFKWKKKQVVQLWEDILAAHDNNRKSYYLGTLLLVPLDADRVKVSVIDGQQRITTLSILVGVLRDRCKEFSEKSSQHKKALEHREKTAQELLSRLDNSGNPVHWVVKLQYPDNDTYVKLVKETGSTQSYTSQEGLLAEAAKTLIDSVAEFLETSDPEDKLQELFDFVIDKVKLLPIEVPSESEGYLIFDTTNTRGLHLSPSEALKARLATIARKDLGISQELIAKWDTAARKLESEGQPIDAMDDYIHAVWSSEHGYTSKRTLEKIASKLDDTPNLLKSFVEDVDSYIDSYIAVVSPRGNPSLNEDLKDLKNLNKQSHAFLMAVHKHNPDRFEEAVDIVLSLQIRNVTIGLEPPRDYEKDWPKWAVSVRKGKLDKAFDEIRSRMQADDQFIERFETRIVKSAATARHLLRRLDPISRPGSGVQPQGVDVEHILPKSVVSKLVNLKKLTKNTSQWIDDLGYEQPESEQEKEALGNELNKYLNMLGNQALFDNKANRGVKDRPFSEKKEKFYSEQKLELTKTLYEKEDWSVGQIKARQKEMAKAAPHIWRKSKWK